MAEAGYGNRHPSCVYHAEVWDAQTAECDAFQSALEPCACRMADRVQRVHSQFDRAGRTALDLCGLTVIQVRARAQPVIVLGRHCSGIMPTTDVVTGGKRVLAGGCVDVGKCAPTLSSVATPVSW